VNVIIQQQPQATLVTTVPGVVISQIPAKPQDYTMLACFTFWFCNPLFGIIAFFYSVSSSREYEQGNYLTAARHGLRAREISKLGIILTIIIVIIVIPITSTMHGTGY